MKQVIVLRKDLNMRKGKIGAQAAHASMKVFFDRLTIDTINPNGTITYKLTIKESADKWINKEGFIKIVCYVNSEEELLNIYNKAKEKNLLCSLITDSGRTEFKGVATNTAIAIGPEENDVVDEITKHLPLY